MSAYLASPLPLVPAQVGGSYTASAPLANLLNDRMGMVWRSASTSGDYITVNVDAAIDTVALWATNMTAGDSVRVRLSNDASGSSPAFDQTFGGERNMIILLPAIINAKYVRLDFNRSGGTAFVQIARLIIAKSVITDGISAQAEQTYEDRSQRNNGPNWESFDKYGVVHNYKCSVEGIEEDDFFQNWDPLLNKGASVPFVFIPFYPSNYMSQTAILARFSADPKVTWITGVDRRIEMQIRGIS